MTRAVRDRSYGPGMGVSATAAIGIRPHSGWAVVVAVGAPPRVPGPRPAPRRGAGRGRPPPAVARGPAAASWTPTTPTPSTSGSSTVRARRGCRAGRPCSPRSPPTDHVVRAVGIAGEPRDLPPAGQILRNHMLLHSAEGELYRSALTCAAAEAGLPVTCFHPKSVPMAGYAELSPGSARPPAAPGPPTTASPPSSPSKPWRPSRRSSASRLRGRGSRTRGGRGGRRARRRGRSRPPGRAGAGRPGRRLEREGDVLLDQRARRRRCRRRPGAGPGSSCSTTIGARPRLSSSTSRSRGRPTSARASASICCSPPDSRPALRSSRALERREPLEHLGVGHRRSPRRGGGRGGGARRR